MRKRKLLFFSWFPFTGPISNWKFGKKQAPSLGREFSTQYMRLLLITRERNLYQKTIYSWNPNHSLLLLDFGVCCFCLSAAPFPRHEALNDLYVSIKLL